MHKIGFRSEVKNIVEQDITKLLTIHPLKEGQKEKRIKTGRWRKI